VNIPLVDLKAGYQPLKAEILKAVEGVLEGMNLHIGPNVRTLESEFAAYCGSKYAVGVGSGTDAILIALKAAGIKAGDEIITTPHTFFATVEAIVLAGAVPVFADIDLETFDIDPGQAEKKITKRTKAFLPVHMYGQAADMKPLLALAEKHGLKVIEDACQAHGAEYGGKLCGSFGTAGCFSFYYTKNLGAYGEGGIISTDDQALAESAGKYRNHGHKSKYEHEMIAYNSRLDEVQAAILRIRLKRLDEYNAARRNIAAKYKALLTDTPLILPKEAEGRKHVYHLYVVRSKERDALQQYLADAGVGTGIHYKKPVHLQEACAAFGYREGDFPVTERICNEILSLPIYPELKDEQIQYIATKVKEFYVKG
jgi:dTDP-4-amino-4,6-dideoxygalactose transaminase